MHFPQDRAARRRNLVLAILLLLAIAIVSAPHQAETAPGSSSPDAIPVVRLPPVEVVARRGVEPAGDERDAAPDAARAAQTRLEAKPST